MGGDLGFDPLGLRPSEQEAWERVQLRELKNGRLAMFAILGMIVPRAWVYWRRSTPSRPRLKPNEQT